MQERPQDAQDFQAILSLDSRPNLLRRSETGFLRALLAIFCLLQVLMYLLSSVEGKEDFLAVRAVFLLIGFFLLAATRRNSPFRRRFHVWFFGAMVLYSSYVSYLAWTWGLPNSGLTNSVLVAVAVGLALRRPLHLALHAFLMLALHGACAMLVDGGMALARERLDFLLPWVLFTVFLYVYNSMRIRSTRHRELNQRLMRGVYHHSSQAILLVDPATSRVLHHNERARDLFALPPGAGRTLDEFVSRESHGRASWSDAGGPSLAQFECSLRKPQGENFHARVHYENMRLNGSPLLLVRIDDLQELKSREETLRVQRLAQEEYSQRLKALLQVTNHASGTSAHVIHTVLIQLLDSLPLGWCALIVQGEGMGTFLRDSCEAQGSGELPPGKSLLEMAEAAFQRSEPRYPVLEEKNRHALPAESLLLSLPLEAGRGKRAVLLAGGCSGSCPLQGSLLEDLLDQFANTLNRFLELERLNEEREELLHRHQSFFDLSAAFLGDLDSRGRLVVGNRYWKETAGIDLDPDTPPTWCSLLHEDDRRFAERKLEEARRTRRPTRFTGRLPLASGKVLVIQWELIADVERDISFLAGQDISERHAVEERLRDSEGLLREFVLHAPASMAMFDREQKYRMASLRWLNEYRLQGRDWMGKAHGELIPVQKDVLAEIHAAAMEGRSCEEAAVQLDFPGRGPEWISWQARPWRQADGEIGGSLVFTEIISERLQEQKELRDTSEELRCVIEALPDLFFKLDAEGRFQDYHAESREQLLADPENFIGQHVEEVLPPALSAQVLQALERARKHQKEQDFEFDVPLKGELRFFEARLRPLHDEHVIFLVRDITDRRRNEQDLKSSRDEAQQALKAKSDFLAMMSHEIRTPMNGVIGMTHMLMETSLDHEQLDLLNTIQQSGDALVTVINDILDFSKIEAGRVDLESRAVDLRDLCESVLDLLKSNTLDKDLELLFEMDHTLPSHIDTDPVRLRQVLLNLAGNAIKFTRQGHVRLRIRPPEEDGGQLVFEVEDTGIGISEEAMTRLFQSFSQADSSTTRKFGGTGLGLSISRSLVEMMGGVIGVDSEEGVGSVFRFTHPLRPSREARRGRDRRSLSLLQGKRIQLVGGPPVLLQHLENELQGWSASCVQVPLEEDQVMKLPDRADCDLVLLCLERAIPPGRGKLELLKAFQTGTLPPLIHLSRGRADNSRESRQFGLFHSVIPRPCRRRQLISRVLDALGLERRKPSSAQADSSEGARKLGERIPLRILLVEDNRVNQKVALRMLEKLGYRADLAQNGLEAFEMIQGQAGSASPYQLVFMDMQMPVMDGLESSRLIRAEIPAEQQPVILAMTANAMKEDQERCMAAGMNDFITKPVHPKVVQEKLRHWAGDSAFRLQPQS